MIDADGRIDAVERALQQRRRREFLGLELTLRFIYSLRAGDAGKGQSEYGQQCAGLQLAVYRFHIRPVFVFLQERGRRKWPGFVRPGEFNSSSEPVSPERLEDDAGAGPRSTLQSPPPRSKMQVQIA